MMTPYKVLITGLGQLGLAVAKYVKERGFDTYGYDINTNSMEIAKTTAGIKQVTDFGSYDFDVYVAANINSPPPTPRVKIGTSYDRLLIF